MNLLLYPLNIYIPAFIKKKKLLQLFEMTALAFKTNVPELKGLSFNKCLQKYALFTKEETERSIVQNRDIDTIKNILYVNSYQLGEELRNNFHIKTIPETIFFMKIIYRILDIEFGCNLQGETSIGNCFFSSFYTEEVCKVISSIDEGFASGISGGGKLGFYERITGGKSCCKAKLFFKEDSI